MAYPSRQLLTASAAVLTVGALLVAPASGLGARKKPQQGTGTTAPVATPFVKVATHPQAVTQPTELGRTLATLKSWNGKLYSGYGDYGANTGPISVSPFDGAGFSSEPELIADTEATYAFRAINGKLYAPSIDPRVSSDVAIATGGSERPTWTNPTLVSSSHAFDVATLTGSDLWIVGSQGMSAVVWRSADGGASWQMSLAVGPVSGKSGDFARFYGAGVYGGKLYVQAKDWLGGTQARSKVFDGNTWSDGPNLGSFNHAESFAGKMIYHSGNHSGTWGGFLNAFDGTVQTRAHPTGIWDYAVEGDTVYVLTIDGWVKKSRDLVSWTQVAAAPSVARSIAVFQSSLYLGGTDSGLYRYGAGTGGS